MRVSTRLGRGLWITGGGGVLAFALAVSVFRGLTLALVTVAASTLVTLVVLIARGVAASKAGRRTLLGQILQGEVEIPADEALSRGAKVWGVYAVGNDFHHGPHPDKGVALKHLYPSQAEAIARVSAFSDAQRASRAAAALRRHRFSFGELLKLFPEHYRPASRQTHDAQGAAPRANPIILEASMPRPEADGRDLTKYRFGGETLGKGRLVLALVKQYVRDHPEADFAALRAAFPDALQGDSPIQFSSARNVVARLDDVASEDRKRYFIAEDELVRLRDSIVLVSREWNRFNIQNVLTTAARLGYTIT